MLLIGLPALVGILASANDWRVEATLRLRTGHIGVAEQSASLCHVDPTRLPGITAARVALERTAVHKGVATSAQFEQWLQAGHATALKRSTASVADFCEGFDKTLDSQNRFWQARADRWKSDASGF